MKRNRIPNLFLVGAPKAGTSSLHKILSLHPDVFAPTHAKEMNFMAYEGRLLPLNGPGDRDHGTAWSLTTIEQYLAAYSGWENEKYALDASPSYLYYEHCAARIKHYSPHAKILIILRNPIDAAFSMYSMLRRDNRESQPFLKAFSLSSKRRKMKWEHAWDYQRRFLYADQVKRYLDVFPVDQIMILKYELFKDHPDQVLAEIARFLSFDRLDNLSGRVNEKPTRRHLMNHTQFGRCTLAVWRQLQQVAPSFFVWRCEQYLDSSGLRLKKHERAELAAFYDADIKEIEKLVSWKTDDWV